jgi:hypothetical protein
LSFVGKFRDFFLGDIFTFEKGVDVDERGKVSIAVDIACARPAGDASRTLAIIIVRAESEAHC